MRIFVTFMLTLSIAISEVALSEDTLDVIQLKNGSQMVGEIVKIVPNESVTLLTTDSSTVVLQMTDVEQITMREASGSAAELHEPPCSELGVTLGTPAGINAVVGYFPAKVGFRLSGMYYSDLYGVQLGFVMRISDNLKLGHSLVIIGGTAKRDKGAWTYGGIAYHLNAHGFFLEFGLMAGEGDYSTPQVASQIGYLFRFLER